MKNVMGYNRDGKRVVIYSGEAKVEDLIQGAKTSGINVSGIRVCEEELEVCIQKYYFKSAKFSKTKLTGNFNRCRFINCNFLYLKANIAFYNCRFYNCTFRGIEGKVLRFDDCKLVGCKIETAYPERLIIRRCKAKHCDFNTKGLLSPNSYIVNCRLTNCILPPYSIVPAKGSFIAYKTLLNSIAILRIPAKAARLTATNSRKCRASHVEVLAIVGRNGTISSDMAPHYEFYYKKGKITPNFWDPNPTKECSFGLHFFITLQEAIEYNFITKQYGKEITQHIEKWEREHKEEM